MQWKSTVRFTNKGGADANAAAQTQFFNTLTANYNKVFPQFQQTLTSLNNTIQGIMNGTTATPYGFSPTEDAALRTDATTQTANAYKNASTALNSQLNAEGGGDSFLPSGAADQLKAQLASSAAQSGASAQTAITENGYQTGRDNLWKGVSGELGILGEENPNSFASAATSQGNATTNAINVANTTSLGGWGSVLGAALGGATGALTKGLTGGLNLFGSSGSPLTSSVSSLPIGTSTDFAKISQLTPQVQAPTG